MINLSKTLPDIIVAILVGSLIDIKISPTKKSFLKPSVCSNGWVRIVIQDCKYLLPNVKTFMHPPFFCRDFLETLRFLQVYPEVF
jgi:hypothetical protein